MPQQQETQDRHDEELLQDLQAVLELLSSYKLRRHDSHSRSAAHKPGSSTASFHAPSQRGRSAAEALNGHVVDTPAAGGGELEAACDGTAFGMLKKLLSQPPCPQAASLTLTELQSKHKTTVGDLALNLQRYEAHLVEQLPVNPNSTISTPLANIKHLVNNYLCLFTAISFCHPEGPQLLSAFTLANFQTGQQVQPQHCRQHHSWVIQQLGLELQLQQKVTEGLTALKELQRRALQETQQLQASEQQMQKLAVIKSALSTHMLSCLSPLQLGRLLVLSTPLVPDGQLLAEQVAEQFEAVVLRQQQQQLLLGPEEQQESCC